MKHFHHTVFRVTTLLIFVAMSVAAQAQSKAPSLFELLEEHLDTITVPYISVDAQNRPIVLSARVAYPLKHTADANKVYQPDTIKYIVIANHGTIMKDSQRPTGSEPLDGAGLALLKTGLLNKMANYGALVIQCDYLGYGWSNDRIHPYCNPDLTARNVLDGFTAVLDTIQARSLNISPDYYTLNLGYSQGGEVSMAVQRYLETNASQELCDKVRLKKSICGAGPYDLELEFDELCKEDSLGYPCSLPMTLESLKEAYNDGCLRAVNLDDIYLDTDFRQEFRKHLFDKDLKTDQVTAWMQKYFGKEKLNLNDLFHTDMLTDGSATSRAMRKALHKCNILDGSWIPQHPMVLFHYSGDKVVHPQCSTEACELFGDKVTFYDENSNLNSQLNASVSLILNQITNGEPKTHSDWGICFYAWVVSGILQ